MKYKITREYVLEGEKTIWRGNCSEDDLQVKFRECIRDQLILWNADPKGCRLRAYNEFGEQIFVETFHAK